MFALGFLLGVAAMAVTGYYTDKKFKEKVQADASALSTELSSLGVRLAQGKTLVEEDLTQAKTVLANIFSKL